MTQQDYSARSGFTSLSVSWIFTKFPNTLLSSLKYPVVLFCLGAMNMQVHAAWTELESGTRQDLYAVDFPVDASTGYVVGRKGTIIKTTNGGERWQKSRSRTRDHLYDVDFISNKVGYAVGVNGTVLKTVDAGKKWRKLESGRSEHLMSVQFINEQTGYVGGANRTLLKTTDGGKSWTELFISNGWVRDIVFPGNGQIGYVSTIAGTLGYIFKTTDGGQSWKQVLFMEDAAFSSMSFPQDDQIGYVTNHDTYYQHGIWKTLDGGLNWNLVSAGHKAVTRSVSFPVDSQTGTAVGNKGAVLTTRDGGMSWSEGSAGVDATLKDVHFVNNSVGYAVGEDGLVVKTADTGTPSLLSLYLYPTSSGSINTFITKAGCDMDWDCVNDQPGNAASGLPVSPDFGSYVADDAGNRAMFALDDAVIAADKRVTEVCVYIGATQFTGPYASLSYQRAGIDTSPVDSPAFWVGSYWYNGVKNYCWQGLDWQASDLDTLEIGVKSVTGQFIQVSQLYVKVMYQ